VSLQVAHEQHRRPDQAESGKSTLFDIITGFAVRRRNPLCGARSRQQPDTIARLGLIRTFSSEGGQRMTTIENLLLAAQTKSSSTWPAPC
jgi:ABC-type branched-subunit amino acid transport system ATPase component